MFAPDVEWLRRLWPGVEGLEEALAALPVYRTYVRDAAGARGPARAARGGLDRLARAGAARRSATRFQQLTPPIKAKGVEDTAFYRYVRLLALNEVGGDPSRFAIDVDAFHAANAARAERFPRHLLTTQTHDTKRSGDVRARIGALAGMAEDWAAAVRRWRELCAPLRAGGAPDAVEEYTIFQTLVGAWPLEPERLCAYMEKALREAKRNTSWIEPDAGWEGRVLGYCRALYDHAPFREAFEPFAARVAAAGERHALRQTALKLTVPGVPDVYQGDELVALSLVDPDNRRPVDWARRRALLDELRDGGAPDGADARKLFLIRELLALRARRPEAFAGGYTPLDAGRRRGRVPARRRRRGRAADPRRRLDPPVELPHGDWRPASTADLLPGAGITVLERSSASQRAAAPRPGDRARHPLDRVLVEAGAAEEVEEQRPPARAEAGAGQLGPVEHVDRELERLSRLGQPDQPVDVLDAGRERVRVDVGRRGIVLAGDEAAARRHGEVVGRVHLARRRATRTRA